MSIFFKSSMQIEEQGENMNMEMEKSDSGVTYKCFKNILKGIVTS